VGLLLGILANLGELGQKLRTQARKSRGQREVKGLLVGQDWLSQKGGLSGLRDVSELSLVVEDEGAGPGELADFGDVPFGRA
jgi:hypothetical protein